MVGFGLAAVLQTKIQSFLLVAYLTALGTFVDLDHYVIARIRRGSWEPLRRSLGDPRMALFDQDAIFEDGDVGQWARLASHVLLTVALAGLLVSVSRPLAVASVTVLAIHIGCDIAWDRWIASRE